MKEEFKEIEVYGVKLIISNLGRVFLNGKERKYNYSKDGYLRISLKNRTPSVHILVAKAFIYNDNPIEKTEVNHKDFNRANPRVDNLEWVTHRDNVKYSKDNGRYKAVDKYGKNNPNYKNNKLSIFYKENPEIALKKQSRKGITNGRATGIKMYKDGLFIKDFEYIKLCLEYLQSNYSNNCSLEGIRSQINKAIKNNKTYKGFTFVKCKK